MGITTKKSNPVQFSIKKVDNLESIKEAWLLLENHSTSSFFLTWSWIGPWAKMVLAVTDLYLFSCEINDKNIALCFITLSDQKRVFNLVKSKQVHLNESLATDYNMVLQYNDILIDDSHRDIIWTYFIQALEEWKVSWDEINIRSVTPNNYEKILKASSKFKQILYREDVTWCVPLTNDDKDFAQLLPKFKSKSRQQLRQSIKAYNNKIGELSWKVAEDIEDALTYFNEMESLHTKRWAKVDEDGAFSNNKWVDFNIDVINEGFPKGEILLLKIKCESIIIGYLYGFLHNSTAYMYQTGFINTNDNKLRPGYISHLSAMIYCAQKNIKSYDFMPDPANSYKKFFSNAGEPIFHIRLQRLRLKFIIENTVRRLHKAIKSLYSKNK